MIKVIKNIAIISLVVLILVVQIIVYPFRLIYNFIRR